MTENRRAPLKLLTKAEQLLRTQADNEQLACKWTQCHASLCIMHCIYFFIIKLQSLRFNNNSAKPYCIFSLINRAVCFCSLKHSMFYMSPLRVLVLWWDNSFLFEQSSRHFHCSDIYTVSIGSSPVESIMTTQRLVSCWFGHVVKNITCVPQMRHCS